MEESQQEAQKFRQYHPFQDYISNNSNIDLLYKLPTSPEHLFPAESAAYNRRTFVETLGYYAGSAYLIGILAGSAKGTIDGLRSAEPGDSAKIRLSRVLNSGGHSGRRFGNSLGAMGMIFAGLEGGLESMRDTDDLWNSVAAGLGTGAVYRAASGPRSAAIAAVVGGLVAGAVVRGKQVFKRFVPI